MLLRQHCCGSQHRHLFPSGDGFKDRSNSDFRFPEAHITTNQPVHRLWFLHVSLDIHRGLELVRGGFVGEGILELNLPWPIDRKGKPCSLVAFGVELHQIKGNFAHRLGGPLLRLHPSGAAHFAELRRSIAVSAKTPQTPKLIGSHSQDAIGILNNEVIANLTTNR